MHCRLIWTYLCISKSLAPHSISKDPVLAIMISILNEKVIVGNSALLRHVNRTVFTTGEDSYETLDSEDDSDVLRLPQVDGVSLHRILDHYLMPGVQLVS